MWAPETDQKAGHSFPLTPGIWQVRPSTPWLPPDSLSPVIPGSQAALSSSNTAGWPAVSEAHISVRSPSTATSSSERRALKTSPAETRTQLWSSGTNIVEWMISGLPWWLSGKESTCQWRRCGFDPWVRKIPWREKWQPTPVFLPGKSHGQRSLVGYSPWGHKELDMT